MKKKFLLSLLSLSLSATALIGCKNKFCNHVDANKDYKCDLCSADMDVFEISLTKMPDTHFLKGTDFSAKGMEVTCFHNGVSTILTEDQYVVDSSSFNKNKLGEYEIRVSLKSDSKIFAKYTAKVVQIESIKPNDDYRKVLILDEDDDFENFDLKLYFVYSDGYVEELSEFQYENIANIDLDTDSVGKHIVEIGYLGFNCYIQYNVISPEDATVKSVSLNPKMPFICSTDELSTYINNLKNTYDLVTVEFEECPNKTYQYHATVDASELEHMNPSNPHSCNVYFTCGEITEKAAVDVVSLEGYIFDKLEVIYDKDYNLYYKEDLGDFEDTFSVYACYYDTYFHEKTLKMPVKSNKFSLTSGNTDAAQKNVDFIYTSVDYGSFTITHDVLPLIEPQDGDYYYLETYFTRLEEPFLRYENGVYYSYITRKGKAPSLVPLTISKVKHTVCDGIDCLEVFAELQQGNDYGYNAEEIYIECESKKIHGLEYAPLGCEIATVYYPVFDDDLYFYLLDGKFSNEQIEKINDFGELHKCTIDDTDANNIIVDVGDKVDMNGHIKGGYYTTVFTQQDASGQPFLGLYLSNDFFAFSSLRIENDKLIIDEGEDGEIVCNFTFTYLDGIYELKLSFFGLTIIIEGDTATINYANNLIVLTKQQEK